MKTKLRLIASVATTAFILSSLSIATAKEGTTDSATILKQLKAVPNPELPAKAASLVLGEQGEDRQKVAETIVSTAVEINPVAAPMIVASVSKLSPDLAPAIASIAASKEPTQTRAIAKAAAGAAPSQALKIVAAMCKMQPGQFKAISTGVAESVPKMDRSIVASVIEAVPTLKPFYLRASKILLRDSSSNPSVASFMDVMTRDIDNSAKALKVTTETLVASGVTPTQQTQLPAPPAPPSSPIVRPPFTPGGGTPGEINRNQTVEVAPGSGRNYSAP